MPTLRELRLQAHLSVAELARQAGIDRGTVDRAEKGTAIQDFKAYAIVEALEKKLNRKIGMDGVTDLRTL